MGYYTTPRNKLKRPRRICSCACCGTKDLLLVRTNAMFGSADYCIEHDMRCTQPYWYTKDYSTINAAVEAWNNKNEEWQDGFDLVWFEIDNVYETRWDCQLKPEGVRQVA